MDIHDYEHFQPLDYIFFVILFIVSASIGLYYAIRARKTITTVDDYLLGGRNMGLIPVSCSLAATSISATTTVGQATEAYAYGTYMWIYVYGSVVMGILLTWIFLPLFSELKLTTVFKYFELRFNRRVRLLASGLYLFSGIIYLSYTVYVPALIFQRVSGVDIYLTIMILSVITAVYTAIGGFKAVIWTDVLQLGFIFGSTIIVICVGIYSVNGIENVIDASNRGGRLYIANTTLNSRTSIWGHLFSTVFLTFFNIGLNQANVQRFMSISNLKKMKISVWILVVLFSTYMCLSPALGVIIYANYETCDPFTAGIIEKIDQIVPHFIQERAYLFHGFNGIFIAGIFSASLSTASSYLNALSGIVFEDFIKQKYPTIKEATAGRIVRITVYILAILQIGSVFFIEKLGTITQIAFQIMSLNTCALLSLFVLGIFIPKANSKGAQVGALASIACILTLIIGSIDSKPEPMLPFRTDGCVNIENLTDLTQLHQNFNMELKVEEEHSFSVFKINFNYYGLIGLSVGLIVGYLVSLLTGGNKVKDQRLIAKFLRNECLQNEDIHLKPDTELEA